MLITRITLRVISGYVTLIYIIIIIIINQLRKDQEWSYEWVVSLEAYQNLMNYIDIYKFLNDPEKAWISIVEKKKAENQNSLFPKLAGAYF